MDIVYIIFMIPFAGIALGAYAVWSDHRLKMLDKQSEISAEKAAQYAANNERLEQRLATLETIITDKGFDVASQIEDLRDKPLN